MAAASLLLEELGSLPLPIVAACCVALLSAFYLLLLSQQQQHRRACDALDAPIVPGLPLLGNTLALGKRGVALITAAREEYGDAFALRLLGQRVVFVFDPDAISAFFKSPEADVSFKPAVQRFTHRIYGLPPHEFFGRHEALLNALRGLLAPAAMPAHARALAALALPQLRGWAGGGGGETTIDLWPACQRLVFDAATAVLFGGAFLARHGAAAVRAAFLDFEGGFELAASPLPQALQPRFRAARAALLAMLRASRAAGDFDGTPAGALVDGCGMPARLAPNLLLAVLWASQANSIPALFWSLAFLVLPENAAHLGALRAEVVKEMAAAGGGGGDGGGEEGAVEAMVRLALRRDSAAQRCVAEAVRLRMHSIKVRFVAARDLTLPAGRRRRRDGGGGGGGADGDVNCSGGKGGKVHVPRGAILALCPFDSAHDAALYGAGAAAFDPDRAAVARLDPTAVVPGVAGMAFGGGFWRCPGRFFAEAELALLLQLVVWNLDVTPPLVAASTTAVPMASSPQKGHWLTWLARRALSDDAVCFGLGDGARCAIAEARWRGSADAARALPPCELRRLVGFKIPAAGWRCRVTARRL